MIKRRGVEVAEQYISVFYNAADLDDMVGMWTDAERDALRRWVNTEYMLQTVEAAKLLKDAGIRVGDIVNVNGSALEVIDQVNETGNVQGVMLWETGPGQYRRQARLVVIPKWMLERMAIKDGAYEKTVDVIPAANVTVSKDPLTDEDQPANLFNSLRGQK